MRERDSRIDYFDAQAPTWDQEGPSAEAMTDCLARHADLLSLRAGQRLLEVGCGTGKTTAWLVEQVGAGCVTAADFSAEMIARAAAKGAAAEFVRLDVCGDDLGEDVYDVILCFHSFPHFRDQPAALRAFARALKRGGRLIVMHMAGSAHINALHAGLGGAVGDDFLPVGQAWNALLAGAGLELRRHIDRDDLFFLDALAP